MISTVRAKKKFAVGRLSAADRSEPLIVTYRLRSVTAASDRVQ